MTFLEQTAQLYEDEHELWDRCTWERVVTSFEQKVRPDLLRKGSTVALVCQDCGATRVLDERYSLLSIDDVHSDTTEQLGFNTLDS